MAEGRSQLFCKSHPNVVAQTICIRHSLLCLRCTLKHAKSTDCDVQEIDGNEILIDCLLEEQRLSQIFQKHAEYVEKVETQKAKNLTMVIDFHDQIIKRLDEKKSKSIAKINETTTTLLKMSREQMPKLKKLEGQIAEIVEQLFDQSAVGRSDIVQQLETIKTSINDEDKHIPSELDRDCKLNQSITETIDNIEYIADISIGDDVYETCEVTSKIDNTDDVKETSQRHSSKTHDPNYSYVDISTLCEKEVMSKNQKHEKNKPECKREKYVKNEKGILEFLGALFRKQKSKTCMENDAEIVQHERTLTPSLEEEDIYENAQFKPTKHPKHLINKTLKVCENVSSAFKFSKLVYFRKDLIALLSKDHSVVVAVGLDGKVVGKMTFEDPNNIVGINNDQLAVLFGQSCTIAKYSVDSKFQTKGSFQVQEKLGNVTGFDYDKEKNIFALSSLSWLVIFDNLGKVVRKCTLSLHDAGDLDVMTTYDFANDCIYLLSRQNKTLKCYSSFESTVTWTKQFNTQPHSICLYSGVLYISFDDVISSVLTTSGESNFQYKVNELVEKCSAMCVIDDVIICSSDSGNIDKSSELGFLKI